MRVVSTLASPFFRSRMPRLFMTRVPAISPLVGVVVLFLVYTAPPSMRAALHGPFGAMLIVLSCLAFVSSAVRVASGMFSSLVWLVLVLVLGTELYRAEPAESGARDLPQKQSRSDVLIMNRASAPADRVDLFQPTNQQAEQQRADSNSNIWKYFTWEYWNPLPAAAAAGEKLHNEATQGIDQISAGIEEIKSQGAESVLSTIDGLSQSVDGAVASAQEFFEGGSAPRSSDIRSHRALSEDAYFQRRQGDLLEGAETAVRRAIGKK